MKPRFALDLSNEAIRLLERQADGWAEIGKADLSDPRLDRRLATLRSMAENLSPDGFCSKLILPNSQILYLTLEAPGPDAQSRRAQIRRALEGRTPYAADDLTFDWSGIGPSVRVAVLANVTLEEAETFAEAYGFRPAAFVAVPQDGTFGGEPFFGLTSMAARHLPSGLRYDRDQDPVRSTRATDTAPEDHDDSEGENSGAAASADTAPQVAAIAFASEDAVTDPETSTADIAALHNSPQTPPADDQDAGLQPAPDNAPDVAAEATLACASEGSAVEVATEFAEAASVFTFGSQAPGRTAPTTGIEPVASDGTVAILNLDVDPDPASDPEAPFTAVDDLFDATPEPPGVRASALVTDPVIPDAQTADHQPDPEGLTGAPDEAAMAAPTQGFQSRRAPGQSGSEGEHIANIMHRLGGLHAQPNQPAPPPAPRLTMTAVRSVAVQSAGATVEARNPARKLGTAMVEFRSRAGQAAASAGRAGAQGLSRIGERVPGLRNLAANENERTIFGAPRATGANWRRIGVGAVVAVALMAATIGLWTLVISGAEENLQSGQGSSGQVSEPVTEDTALVIPPVKDAALSGQPLEPEPAIAEPGVNIAAPAEPSGAVADNSANLSAVTPDPLPEPADPSLLPGEPLAGDIPLPSQPLPQPYGTTFTYDPDGLIEATPEGVVTPGGFTLIAGRPSRLPPVRPAGITTATAPELAVPDAALLGKRPKAKPPTLVSAPPAAAETDTASLDSVLPPTLAPPSDPRHGALKPRPRPEAIAEAAVALRENAAQLAEAAEAAARAEAEAFEAALRGATPQAVASSRRPAVRPASVAALAASLPAAAPELSPVDGSAVEAALAEAQAEPQVTAAPEPPPEDLDEPEPEDGIATMPTTRTVAKKSTIANAIDLGDVNLIGVYGSSANRRALVRMPNGRYVKVQVGDRLDGGKVAAIGDNELSYVKRGQTIVLKILKKG